MSTKTNKLLTALYTELAYLDNLDKKYAEAYDNQMLYGAEAMKEWQIIGMMYESLYRIIEKYETPDGNL